MLLADKDSSVDYKLVPFNKGVTDGHMEEPYGSQVGVV